MSSLDDWLTQFDSLMDKLQSAATGFALTEQQNLIDTLGVMAQLGAEHAFNKEQLRHIEQRLLSYRELCFFLKKTIQETLQAATQESETSYSPVKKSGPTRGLPILERYG